MKQYLDLLRETLETGEKRKDRTGVGTRGIFGAQLQFYFSDGFPIVTTKKIHFKSVIHELLWMLSGSTNIKYLVDNGVRIWSEWATEDGELGPVYGAQWRNFNGQGIDQISNLIDGIKKDPFGRRHIICAWNPAQTSLMKLPPCHVMAIFNSDGYKLSCMLIQRSADLFLGSPFNVSSYALLTAMVAQVCGLEPYKLVYSIADAHIYNNHVGQVQEQLGRAELSRPNLLLNKSITNIFDFKYEDISLDDYRSWPAIKAPVAV